MKPKVPTGTYTDGYDAGLLDGANGRDREIPKMKRRPSILTPKWQDSAYRIGYDDGYFDGEIVRKRREGVA